MCEGSHGRLCYLKGAEGHCTQGNGFQTQEGKWPLKTRREMGTWALKTGREMEIRGTEGNMARIHGGKWVVKRRREIG